MKFIFTLVLLFSSILFASDLADAKAQKQRVAKQVQIEMEKEKKHAQEQVFHNSATYDFKGSEVNQESLESLPDIVEDDFNMDSVYD